LAENDEKTKIEFHENNYLSITCVSKHLICQDQMENIVLKLTYNCNELHYFVQADHVCIFGFAQATCVAFTLKENVVGNFLE